MARPLTAARPTITSLLPHDWVAGRTDVTVERYIVEQVRAGVDPITAAQTAGVSPPEFLAWMREGALVSAKLGAGGVWETDFTPEQQDAFVLAVEVNRAHATHIATLSVVAEQVARGGVTVTEKRTRTVNGQVAEEVVTTKTTLPDADMLRWKLEKLEPSIYGSKATLNVTVVDLTDTSTAADVQKDRMLEVASSLGVIDTTAIERIDEGIDDDDDD